MISEDIRTPYLARDSGIEKKITGLILIEAFVNGWRFVISCV